MRKKTVTTKEAFLFVLKATCIFWSLTYVLYALYSHCRYRLEESPSYNIVAVVSKSPVQKKLPPRLLQEILDLSQDKPTNMFRFDMKRAKQRFEQYGCFKKVKMRLQRPGVLIVDYDLYEPYAALGDYENLAVDRAKKHIFPMHPFFTPKKLPEIYLGTLSKERMDFAFEVLHYAKKKIQKRYTVISVDVGPYFAFKPVKEIILHCKGENDFFLRLCGDRWKENIAQFINFEQKEEGSFVVDFRVPGIALWMPYTKEKV